MTNTAKLSIDELRASLRATRGLNAKAKETASYKDLSFGTRAMVQVISTTSYCCEGGAQVAHAAAWAADKVAAAARWAESDCLMGGIMCEASVHQKINN